MQLDLFHAIPNARMLFRNPETGLDMTRPIRSLEKDTSFWRWWAYRLPQPINTGASSDILYRDSAKSRKIFAIIKPKKKVSSSQAELLLSGRRLSNLEIDELHDFPNCYRKQESWHWVVKLPRTASKAILSLFPRVTVDPSGIFSRLLFSRLMILMEPEKNRFEILAVALVLTEYLPSEGKDSLRLKRKVIAILNPGCKLLPKAQGFYRMILFLACAYVSKKMLQQGGRHDDQMFASLIGSNQFDDCQKFKELCMVIEGISNFKDTTCGSSIWVWKKRIYKAELKNYFKKV